MSEVKMNMIENALDFLDEAADRLLQEPEKPSRHIKYAILHLFSSVELILKYVVMKKDSREWKAIVRDRNPTLEDFERGDVGTIYWDKACNILINNLNVEIDQDQRELIKRLRNERNRIEHFRVQIQWYVALELIIQTWSFLIDFFDKNVELAYETNEIYEITRDKIFQLEIFVEKRIQETQPDLERFSVEDRKLIISCPACEREALPLGFDEMCCVYCESRFSSQKLMKTWIAANWWSGLSWKEIHAEHGNHLSRCPECELDSMVTIPEKIEQIPVDFLCFECGNYWMVGELDTCVECNETFEPIDGITICDSCLQYKIDNSD